MSDAEQHLSAVIGVEGPHDAAARLAACDVEQSWIVEAPAGSGKTELLMQRFLRLLARVEQPEQVLAITFTRKAAAEMRDRILESLRNARRDVHPSAAHALHTREFARQALENDERRGWNLTTQPQRLNIRTIDSLCSSITARLPVLSRLGAAMRPVENTTELYMQAAQQTLEEMGGQDPRLQNAARTLLSHLDNKLEKGVRILADMLATRDQWGHVFPIDRQLSDEELDRIIEDRFEKTLQQTITEHLQAYTDSIPETSWKKIFALGHHAAKNLEGSEYDNCFRPLLESPAVPVRNAAYLPEWQSAALVLVRSDNTWWRKPGGIKKSIGFLVNTQEKEDLQALLTFFEAQDATLPSLQQLRSLPPARYTTQQKEILRAGLLLLRRAVAHLKITFAHTGKTDFVEIALAAKDALSAGADNLADVFGTAIQHLLVDEMQDTSITQFELFSKLVESWDGHSQTVFLVGDPKQSIYRFRNVEVKLFERARREGLGGIHLQPIQLSSNFRSHQSLVNETNAIFTQIFENGIASDGISFTASDAAHREPATQRIFWHPAIVPAKPKKGDIIEDEALPPDTGDLRMVEARNVCDAIELHRSHAGPGEQPPSIAVLVRARTHAHAILAEMRRRNIPYRAVEMDNLSDRQALLDLLTIARCLLHPADRIAWLAALRAPWCGLSLADLLALCGNDDPSQNTKTVLELFRERGEQLSLDGQQRARRTVEILQAALQSSAHERFSLLVERAWRTLGGPECISAAEAAGVTDFFRMLERMEEAGPLTARALQQEMKKLHASPMSSGDAPVEVLTLFKAKGLEWDVVLMPGLHRQPPNDDRRLIEWVEQIEDAKISSEESDSILLAPIRHTADEEDAVSRWIRSIRAERDRAEQKRLLYVGCTRARQAVHLFGEAATEHTGEIKPPGKDSLLHTAWPVAQEIFSNHAAQSQTSAPAQIIEMPLPGTTGPGIVDDLAAAAASDAPNKIKLSNFQRVPSTWQPAMPPDLHLLPTAAAESAEDAPAFQRPQGSWRARVFGTVLHAFLNPLADRLRCGTDDAPDSALQSFAQPIVLQLRREGFSADEAKSESKRILNALHQTANDATGRWLLTAPAFLPGHGNGFEVPLTTIQKSGLRSVRIDRMFLAGAAPMENGDQFLWIVDFKTAACGADQIEEFLREEQALYRPQLEEYAGAVRAVFPTHPPIRLGLYYPLLRQFRWWACEPV
jgi:ATP-dependent exoDNAse (exonuclease V) beta subunit